uniref:TIR domain-containing protein n=1 Tax=Strigamia maritima TaxID=126957 RepID=T1JAY6_STRMM
MHSMLKSILIVLWAWMFSSLYVYCTQQSSSSNCSKLCSVNENKCASLDHSCTCDTHLSINMIECPKWSVPPFIFGTEGYKGGNSLKLYMNGQQNPIPMNFLEWFLTNIMNGSNIINVDVYNFCNTSSEISNRLDLTGLFRDAHSFLQILKFRNSCLESISGKPQFMLQNLQKLDLSFNNFNQIPKFDDMTTVTEYFIMNNKIGSVSKNDFNNSLLLEQLSISSNKISSLPEDLLFDLENLEELNLSNNSISSVPILFLSKNVLLRKFYINNNNLTQIQASLFQNSRTIEEIDLSHNKIQKLHLNVSSLKRLQVLRAESNNINSLDLISIYNVENLKEILLTNNSLTTLNQLGAYLGSKINFDISRNKISTLYLPLTNYIDAARTLNLSHNCIITYEKKSVLPSDGIISNFICSNCCLATFYPNMFDKVVEKLDLSDNNITKLDENTLKEFQDIPQIILSRNKIFLVNLTHFENTYTNNSNMVDFDLSLNPFLCDCRLNRFVMYLRNQTAVFTFNIQNNYCSKPTQLKGTSLKSINYNLLCEYPKTCPQSCHCYVDDIDNFSFISIVCDNSNLTHFPNTTSYGSTVAIHLNLTSNQISSLPAENDPIWYQITMLDLSYNQLESLKNMVISPKLSILYLNNNSLTEFDVKIEIFSHLTKIRLANNPWKCDCQMIKFVLESPLLDDKYEWFCLTEDRMYDFRNIDQICTNFNLLWLLIPVITLVILVSVTVILYIKYKSEIFYYMFSKGMCLKFVSEEDIDVDKVYDAFVSYSGEDEDWIVDFLVPGLETGIPSYKLCLHSRDWRAGEFITDQIVRSVESSRRTLIVLTDSYLKSEWSRLEFDVAYQQALRDQVRRLIAIVPNEVPDLSKIDQEFKTFITLTTYIEAKKPYFWRKLRASMPRTKSTGRKSVHRIHRNIEFHKLT